jgi:hypothetical protein
MLAFTSVYFFESRDINGLRAFGVKKSAGSAKPCASGRILCRHPRFHAGSSGFAMPEERFVAQSSVLRNRLFGSEESKKRSRGSLAHEAAWIGAKCSWVSRRSARGRSQCGTSRGLILDSRRAGSNGWRNGDFRGKSWTFERLRTERVCP